MKFREWFEARQRADVLCWADEEAAATGWNAALEEAARVLYAMALERCGHDPIEDCVAAIRALKEQA